ncbi:hypothetical protein Q3G72_004094 [Acer saccharum]|nr:hypothetical protein Q3G72_004094 [Acer saccharum]
MDNNNWRPTPPGGEPNMETPDQLMGQSNAANMLPGQQQLMSQIQSLPAQLQQQLGLQQRPNALQRDMQQRLQASSQASGSVLQPQNVVDQQKQLYQSQRALPETSSTSLDSTAGQSNGGYWQEEVYQKIKVMKEMYFPELNEMYQKIATKLQQHDSLPQQPKSDQLEKLKIFKNMLERILGFLQVSKINVQPSYKEKLGSYEKQIVNFINTNRPRKPSMQQGQLPPPHMHSMQQPSQVQLGLQRDMQQRLQASTSLDSTAGQSNGGDWQEEVYQKIKVMKEMYFPELNEMYQEIATKLQQHDSLPQQPKSEQLEKLKIFKNMLERILGFLQVSKINVQPSYKEKLGSYEKQMLNFINTNRPRKPSMQQGQLPPPHMHSMQQPSLVQSHDNQMNPQMQSMDLQGSVATMQQNNMTSLQHNAISSISGVSTAQHNMLNSLQSGSNLYSGQGNT